MPINKQLLGDFAADIYAQNSLSSRFEIFEKYVQRLGFEGVSYTFMPDFSLEKDIQRAPVFMSSELFPNSFIEQYTHDRMDQNDFTVRRIKAKQLAPMDWQEFKHSDELSHAEKSIISIAKYDHNVRNALSIPTMSEDRGIAGASMVSTAKNAKFNQLKKENLGTLSICTQLFHDATVNMSESSLAEIFVIPLLIEMKPKEIIILKYFISGEPLKNINDTTGISYSYASNLLGELRQRLGGISNEKLMYIIGLFNILDDL